MNSNDFVQYIGSHRIALKCVDERLQYRSSIKTSPDFLSTLREYKTALMQAIQPFGNQEVIICPQSYNQQSLWFTNKLFPESSAYNVVLPMLIESALDINRSVSAIKQIVAKNEQLRTVFDSLTIDTQSTPCQFILEHYDNPVSIVDASGFSDTQIETAIQSFCSKPFSLKTECPFKVLLLSCSPEKHYLIFLFHHIVCDAHSIGLFFKNFLKYYHQSHSDKYEPLSYYTNFVFFQETMVAGNSGESLIDFWKNKFLFHQDDPFIPTDFNRTAIKKLNGATVVFNIDTNTSEQIASFCKLLQITPFAFYLACLQLLIILRSGKYTLTTGILSHGRTQPEHKNIIGYFVNPLPLFCSRSDSTTIEEHFKASYKDLLETIDHQHLPFSLLVEKLAPQRDPSRPVFFDILLNMLSPMQLGDASSLIYADTAMQSFTTGELTLKPYPLNQQEGQFDLTFELLQRENYLQGILKYSTDLYTKKSADMLVSQFCAIIRNIFLNRQVSIHDFLGSLVENDTLPAKTKWNLVIASTFTSEILDTSLKFWADTTKHPIEWHFAPYNQVFQQLADPNSLFAQNKGINIILIRLEDLCMHDDNIDPDLNILKSRVSELISLLQNVIKFHATRYLVAISPSSPAILKKPICAVHFAETEVFIQDAISPLSGVYFTGSEYFTKLFASTTDYEPASGIIGHVPYTEKFFTAIGTGIIRLIHAIDKLPCKAIILDCDNTLWEGIVGEDTWKNLKITEPFRAFQRFLLSCKNKGILLFLCSKNNRSDVLDVFENHPDMILSFSDIMFDRINWQPKSKNIYELLQDANLSTSGIIFVDDNPSECAEVRANCPGITVVNLPSSTSKWPGYINNYWAFDTLKTTKADIDRQNKYIQEKDRRSFKEQVKSYAEFINGLNLNIAIHAASNDETARISQLTFRTNQFSTGAPGKNDLQTALLIKNKNVYSVSVNDRFGDYGLVGVIMFSVQDDNLIVDHLLLSCRALGRGVEYKMIAFIGDLAKTLNCLSVKFTISKTGKNTPLILFFNELFHVPVTEDPSSLYYSMPASDLSAIVYNPESYPQPINAHEKQPAAAASQQNTFSDELLHTIAETCSDLDTIFKAINPHHKTGAEKSVNISDIITGDSSQEFKTTVMILHDIWAENLRVTTVSLNDNYFDLGGKSIMLPFMVDQIKARTGKNVSIVDLLQYPTIAFLAKYINEQKLQSSNIENKSRIAERQKKAFARFKKTVD